MNNLEAAVVLLNYTAIYLEVYAIVDLPFLNAGLQPVLDRIT